MTHPDPARAVADFHMGFNIVMALLFFPVLKPFAWVLARLLPVRVDAADPSLPVNLDGAARDGAVRARGAWMSTSG